jgi:hypothetical protein
MVAMVRSLAQGLAQVVVLVDAEVDELRGLRGGDPEIANSACEGAAAVSSLAFYVNHGMRSTQKIIGRAGP